VGESNGGNGNGNGKRRVAVKAEITLGNILAMAVVVIGIGINWGAINARVSAIAKEVALIETSVKACESKEAGHEADTRVHYMISSPAEERLGAISADMAVVKAQLEELTRLLQRHSGNDGGR
jgi:hypothetical protein